MDRQDNSDIPVSTEEEVFTYSILEKMGCNGKEAIAFTKGLFNLISEPIFQKIDENNRQLNDRMDAVESKIDAVESKIDAVESKIDAVESKMDALESKFDSKIDALEFKFDSKMNALEFKIQSTHRTGEWWNYPNSCMGYCDCWVVIN